MKDGNETKLIASEIFNNNLFISIAYFWKNRIFRWSFFLNNEQ